jgi:hypothetical protein
MNRTSTLAALAFGLAASQGLPCFGFNFHKPVHQRDSRSEEEKQRRVVCAANQWPDLSPRWYKKPPVILGARHWDTLMRDARDSFNSDVPSWRKLDAGKEEQGFIDQFGVFMTREEAWKVAEAAGQILYRCGGDTRNGGTLYSENLY